MTLVVESTVPWFPQQYAEAFYLTKGVLALVATVLYLIHMNRAWSRLTSVAQQWRYAVLLYFAALLTTASAEQVSDGSLVNYRNLGGMLGSLALIVAACISLREDRKNA